jgi:hypothetical protein
MKGFSMPRAVKPWTWRRALRDYGPRQQGLLLTLYTLGTFMDENGFAYPGQARLARGARASVRTIRRHMELAKDLGWVGIDFAGKSGQGWRSYLYRAAVPSHVQLTDKDERLSDALIADHGEIERGDTIVSAPSTDVRTADAERADKLVAANVRTQLVPTNSRKRTLVLDEGALSSTGHNQSMIPEAIHRYRLPDLSPALWRASPGTDPGAVGYTDRDLKTVCEEHDLLEIRMLSERWARLRAWAEYDATQPPVEDMAVAGGGHSDQDLEATCEEQACEQQARELLLQAYAEHEATNWPEAQLQ